MRQLTHKRLLRLLLLNQRTGIFTWREKSHPVSHVHIGDVAGCVDPAGYRRICIDGRYYKATRLAAFYKTGRWPRALMDHKRGTAAGDGRDNVRQATPAQNAINRKACGASGYKGVHFRRGKYHVTMGPRGTIRVGTFATAMAAAQAYDAKATELYGRFARLNFPKAKGASL